MLIKPNFCYPGDLHQNVVDGYYLYMGRLSAEKGISMLLDTFGNTRLHLKIAGSGPMEEQIKAATTRHANIEFLGIKTPGEIRQLVSCAKAVIFSSIWYETFGMVIIEAFACGTPVIASAIGEAKHLVVNGVNGLLFNPGDGENLLEKIKSFEAFDSQTLLNMGENALKTYKDNYTPEENLKKLHDVYDAALSVA